MRFQTLRRVRPPPTSWLRGRGPAGPTPPGRRKQGDPGRTFPASPNGSGAARHHHGPGQGACSVTGRPSFRPGQRGGIVSGPGTGKRDLDGRPTGQFPRTRARPAPGSLGRVFPAGLDASWRRAAGSHPACPQPPCGLSERKFGGRPRATPYLQGPRRWRRPMVGRANGGALLIKALKPRNPAISAGGVIRPASSRPALGGPPETRAGPGDLAAGGILGRPGRPRWAPRRAARHRTSNRPPKSRVRGPAPRIRHAERRVSTISRWSGHRRGAQARLWVASRESSLYNNVLIAPTQPRGPYIPAIGPTRATATFRSGLHSVARRPRLPLFLQRARPGSINRRQNREGDSRGRGRDLSVPGGGGRGGRAVRPVGGSSLPIARAGLVGGGVARG